MSEPRLQQLADNAVLKILQYIITAIAVPAIGYGIATIAERLTAIDRALATLNTTSATTELRMRALESTVAARGADLQSIRDKLTGHEFRLQRVEDPKR